MFKRSLFWFHRYGGLLVSLQLLLWSLGGFFMAFWSFGDLYSDPPPRALNLSTVQLKPEALPAILPADTEIKSVQLQLLAGRPFYRVDSLAGKAYLVDQQGQLQTPVSPALATELARSYYTGTGSLQTVDLLPRSSGNYVSEAPVYRALFSDAQQTEIYLHPEHGQLLARRKAIWGWYQRFWRFHLMQYTSSAVWNKRLLLGFALLTFLVSLAGLLQFLSRVRWRRPQAES